MRADSLKWLQENGFTECGYTMQSSWGSHEPGTFHFSHPDGRRVFMEDTRAGVLLGDGFPGHENRDTNNLFCSLLTKHLPL